MTSDVLVTAPLTDPASLTEERVSALATVYRAAFGANGYDEDEGDVERFVGEQLPKHVERKGFRLVEATLDDKTVGFAYGYTGERGQWWSDRVVARLSAELATEWVGGHFEFVELAVDPRAQGQGVGTLLHDALLNGIRHRRALLSTYNDDRPAPRLYRRLGWQLLMPDLDEHSDLYGLDLKDHGGT